MTTTTKRITTRTAKRTRAAELRRNAKAEAARRQEDADEAVAPAVQRNAVMDADGAILRDPNGSIIAHMSDGSVLREALRSPDGTVLREVSLGILRSARVKRDGVAFVRVSPLTWMAANIERHGDDSTFSKQHFRAAERLVTAWDAVGDGIGLGASDWGSLRGSRGTAPTTPAGHSSLVAQVEQRIEIEAAHTWMGSLWSCLEDIALRGMSPTAWAASVGMDRKAAPGYLRAALDRLVDFYKARDHVPERKARIRAVAVGVRELAETC